MSNARSVTDATFSTEVLESDKPVLVDFWAEWCPPCRVLGPILDEIATEHAEKLTVVKIDVDKNPAMATKYGISSIPALKVFSGGEVVKSMVGAMPKQILERELGDILA